LGFVSKGAQRWLDLGPLRLQPPEFMKPAIVLTLARFYELVPAAEIRKWRAIWPALALLGVPALLILVQPDLGTCIMVLLCGVTVMCLAGLPWWVFAAPVAAVAVAAPIVYSFMHGYQRKRIDVFLDPESDPLGAGYHIAQSKIAIGSGGIWGKGFLHGSQSHLQYLPEGHTDFVFATMAEEWGLVGGVILILAFAAVIRWGMRVSPVDGLREIVEPLGDRGQRRWRIGAADWSLLPDQRLELRGHRLGTPLPVELGQADLQFTSLLQHGTHSKPRLFDLPGEPEL